MMPYIFCEWCGEGTYSNVISCPSCGRMARPARRERLRGRDRHDVDYSSHGMEEVESEVRRMLYGWRSQTVQLRREAI